MKRRFKAVEEEVDSYKTRTEELRNFIDIYLPLRFQHQIFETLNQCFDRR